MAHDESHPSQGGPEFEDVAPEMGVNEFWAHQLGLGGLKGNRTYEAYLALGLEAARQSQEATNRSRSAFDKQVSDAQQYDNARQNMANQALQNAIETANMVGKQAVRHSDLAIDREWNVDEQNAVAKTIIDRLSQSTTNQDLVNALNTILTAVGLSDAVKKTSGTGSGS